MARQRVTFAVMTTPPQDGSRLQIHPSAIPLNAVPVMRLMLLEFMRPDPAFHHGPSKAPSVDFDISNSSRIWVGRSSTLFRDGARKLLHSMGKSIMAVDGFARDMTDKQAFTPACDTAMRFSREFPIVPADPDGIWTCAEKAAHGERRHVAGTTNSSTGVTNWRFACTRDQLMPGEVPFPIKVMAKDAELCALSNQMTKDELTMALWYGKSAGIEPHRAGASIAEQWV